MKLLCWNINGLGPTVRNAVLKHGSWLGFFQEHALDVACLQESKLPEDKLTKELCCVDGYQSFWACSRERRGYSGVTTYASEAYAPLSADADCLAGEGDEEDADLDGEGRVVVTDHGAFTLVNVYVPNAGDRPERARLAFKLRFLAALKVKCDVLAAAGRQLLIVGDFNVPAEARDVHPDLLPGSQLDELYSREERAALHALTAAYPDVWRRLHPEATATFTVWNEKTSARAFNRGLRIDYVLCSPGLLPRVVSCEVLNAEALPPKWSDHAGLLLELDVPAPAPHPPCPAWQRLHRRFVDTTQRSILGMFGAAGKKRAAPAASAPAAAAAEGAAGGQPEKQQKKARQGDTTEVSAAAAPGEQVEAASGSPDAAAAAGASPATLASHEQQADGGSKGAGRGSGKTVARHGSGAAGDKQQPHKAANPGQRSIASFFGRPPG